MIFTNNSWHTIHIKQTNIVSNTTTIHNKLNWIELPFMATPVTFSIQIMVGLKVMQITGWCKWNNAGWQPLHRWKGCAWNLMVNSNSVQSTGQSTHWSLHTNTDIHTHASDTTHTHKHKITHKHTYHHTHINTGTIHTHTGTIHTHTNTHAHTPSQMQTHTAS